MHSGFQQTIKFNVPLFLKLQHYLLLPQLPCKHLLTACNPNTLLPAGGIKRSPLDPLTHMADRVLTSGHLSTSTFLMVDDNDVPGVAVPLCGRGVTLGWLGTSTGVSLRVRRDASRVGRIMRPNNAEREYSVQQQQQIMSS